MSVMHQKVRTRDSGGDENLTATVATKDGAPLAIVVERDASTASAKKKTISSGTIVVTRSDGPRVETTFEGVIFDFGASAVCQPTAGKITGLVFAKDATAASATFVISFGATTDSGISIAHDGGAAEDYPDYNSKGCDLEDE